MVVRTKTVAVQPKRDDPVHPTVLVKIGANRLFEHLLV